MSSPYQMSNLGASFASNKSVQSPTTRKKQFGSQTNILISSQPNFVVQNSNNSRRPTQNTDYPSYPKRQKSSALDDDTTRMLFETEGSQPYDSVLFLVSAAQKQQQIRHSQVSQSDKHNQKGRAPVRNNSVATDSKNKLFNSDLSSLKTGMGQQLALMASAMKNKTSLGKLSADEDISKFNFVRKSLTNSEFKNVNKDQQTTERVFVPSPSSNKKSVKNMRLQLQSQSKKKVNNQPNQQKQEQQPLWAVESTSSPSSRRKTPIGTLLRSDYSGHQNFGQDGIYARPEQVLFTPQREQKTTDSRKAAQSAMVRNPYRSAGCATFKPSLYRSSSNGHGSQVFKSTEKSPFQQPLTVQRDSFFQSEKVDKLTLSNVRVLMDRESRRVYAQKDIEHHTALGTMESIKTLESAGKIIFDDTGNATTAKVTCKLREGDLHHFNGGELLQQLRQGDVCKKIETQTLCNEDQHAVKKFMKRQNRPNTSTTQRVIYNGVPHGQYRKNQEKLSEVESKVNEYIKKPISLYDETKAWLIQRDKVLNARDGIMRQIDYGDSKNKKDSVVSVIKDPNDDSHEYKAEMGKEDKEAKVVSVAAIGLRQNHHLLTATVKYNTNRLISDVKEGRGAGEKNRIRFGQEYDIQTKGAAFKVLRKTTGGQPGKSKSNVKKRQDYERQFNDKCRMVQSKHIKQMVANVEQPRKPISLNWCTEQVQEKHAKRVAKLRQHASEVANSDIDFVSFGQGNPNRNKQSLKKYQKRQNEIQQKEKMKETIEEVNSDDEVIIQATGEKRAKNFKVQFAQKLPQQQYERYSKFCEQMNQMRKDNDIQDF